MALNRIGKCTICSIKTCGANGFFRHIRQVHGNDRYFGTNCPLCPSSFIYTNIKSFIRHYVQKHPSNFDLDDDSSSIVADNDENSFVGLIEDKEISLLIGECDSLQEIKRSYIKMMLKLREGHILPGHVMKTLALSISGLFQSFFEIICTTLNTNVDNIKLFRVTNEIEKYFLEVSKSEESFVSFCRMYFEFIKPQEILFHTGSKAYYVPLRELLLSLFSKKDVQKCANNEKEFITQFNGQDIIYHYRNAEIGQQHNILKNTKNCYLLQLYSDDLGVVNPLMGKSATHKLTTFYFSIDDLPARKNSSLASVYLLMLCHRRDFDDSNNRQILFQQLKQDLMVLEQDGIVLPGDDFSTHFTISTVCADNLAGRAFVYNFVDYCLCLAHELGGFMCSFNNGHCCRYCLCHHKDMKNVYKESQVTIRTRTSYDLQVKHVQEVSIDKQMYGINEKSILLTLPSLHPMISLPPDIMHDVLEGVMPKVMSCLLHTMISTRLFTATQICQRVNQFEYGKNDRRNRPPFLKERDIFDKRIPGEYQSSCLNEIYSYIDHEQTSHRHNLFSIKMNVSFLFRQSDGEVLLFSQLAVYVY